MFSHTITKHEKGATIHLAGEVNLNQVHLLVEVIKNALKWSDSLEVDVGQPSTIGLPYLQVIQAAQCTAHKEGKSFGLSKNTQLALGEIATLAGFQPADIWA